MSIACDQFDLLFTHVPKTGGVFVEKLLADELNGHRVGSRHSTFRWLDLSDPPAVRAFTVRDPLDWYRSYWAYARGVVKRPAAWPIWQGGRADHPTHQLDQTCGSPHFETFVRNVLREFPNGFVRSMYCDFLNGSTHVLRTDRLATDLGTLLEVVGHPNPAVSSGRPRVNESNSDLKRQATLPRELENELREVDNLVGLTFPWVDGSTSPFAS